MLSVQKQSPVPYGIDVSLLVERLKLSPTERVREHIRFMEFVEKLKDQARRRDKFSRSPEHSSQT